MTVTDTISMNVRRSRLGLATAVATCLVASGCSTLPSAGPTGAQIRSAAKKQNEIGFQIVDIDASVTQQLNATPATPASLASLAAEGRIDTLGAGDILDISIYEVGITLFSGATAPAGVTGGFDPSARGTTLAAVTVDADGSIQLPYVGRLQVAGATAVDVSRMIEGRMRRLSQQPQALVSVRQNQHNVYYVSGDVRAPGRFALTLPGERLLDALARAGGTVNAPGDMIVRLTRGPDSSEARLSDIDSAGAENVRLLPGDRIELLNSPRTYLVFGATDKVSQVSFSAGSLSLAEALARIGGPSERIADPAAIYLFRYGPVPEGVPEGTPVIYRLNMVRADSYFISQRFVMQDKDVIYIATAAASAPGKLTQILGQLFSPFLALQSVAR